MPAEMVDKSAARKVITDFLRRTPAGGWLDMPDAVALAAAAGVPLVDTVITTTLDDAVATARRLGFPVVLKGVGRSIIHKTESGAVRLSLDNEAAVRRAGVEMAAHLGDQLEGFVVQRMAPSGLELLAGLTTDPSFGPLVIYGAGGTAAELLRDRIVRPAPLTLTDPTQMVRSLRISPLLDGYRGIPKIDHAPIEQLLVRVGQLADAVPEIVELDLNPIIATPSGLHVVDLRIRAVPYVAHPELSVRRLR
jgi:acyl-CoA synthetase (NDP forming)